MPRKIYFVSLGCPKNTVDTEVMLGQVDRAGHVRVDDPSEAETIVVNTCGFIDSAVEESIDTILEMAQYKSQGQCENLIVTGCLTQRYPGQVASEIPEIDHILGSADFAGIASAIELPVLDSQAPVRRRLPVITVSETPAYLYDHETPRVLTGPRYSAYVKIAEGCDRPCSFCIIPKLRGAQRSRAPDSVEHEVRRLVAEGTREVNLIAQDLTRYGVDLARISGGAPPTLAELLRRVARVDDLRWLRLHYTYPTAFTDELISAIAEEPTVVKYVDVPLQHAADAMLKRMRRGHGARATHELIDRLRSRIDGLVLRTTFIVGHPGETDAEFELLYELVEQTRFDHVGVFTYSSEAGTVSATLAEPVPAAVALERRARLMELQQGISRAKQQAMIGSRLEVLVDGISGESDLLLQGRWYGQAPGVDGVVYLADGTAAPGEFVDAEVTGGADYDLAASILPAG